MEFFNSLLLALAKILAGIGMWIALALGGFHAPVVVKIPSPPAPAVTSPVAAVASSTATATSKQISTPAPKKEPVTIAQATSTAAPAPSTPAQITNDVIAQTNTAARASLVNILCSFRTQNSASYISGSGLVVDSRGVILTNAHVAQFFLLQHSSPDSASCIVRTGNPAAPAYTATLLYLPPAWIESNAYQILADQPMGTGEHDYAFLYITGPAQSSAALPASFSALPLSTQSPATKEPVLLAAYPAGLLDANEVEQSLYISSAVSAVGQLYTFDAPTHTDLISLGGTVVSQGGSSGGAVIDLANGSLIGVISSESAGTTTASRDLRAITLSYINRSLAEDGKGNIASLLSGDLLATSQKFNADVAPALTKELTAAIDKNSN